MGWPIEPRPGQREVAEHVAKLLERGNRVLFSAPTGWGKTMAVIAALVEAKLFPVVWLVRSLTIGRRIAEDAALWGLTTFIAAGRNKTCLLKSVRDVDDFCRYYKFKCPHFRLPQYIVHAVSYIELIEKSKGQWCPYYAQDLIESDVVIQNYFRRMKHFHFPKAFIVDEAHNLLMPRERTYSISRIVETIAAARQLGASEKLLLGLESLMKYMLIRDGPLDAGLYLDEDRIEELRRLHAQGLEQGVSLRPLLDLVSSITYIEGERVVVYAPPTLPPYRPAVYISATLPPGAEELLGAEAVLRIPWLIKPKCTLISDVTTKFEEFDSRMALRYKKLILEMREHKRVIVFAASERVARELRGIANFEECVPPPNWEGVLLLRARGRYAEGIDIPADAVIIAGAPYLPPSVGEWLARQLRRIGIQDPVRAAIDIPMLTTTLQCVGRAWRDPSKKPPQVFLADSRFERYSNVLGEYFALE